MIRKLFCIQIIVLVLSLWMVFLIPQTAYCVKDGQIVTMTRREIYFEMKTDKTVYRDGDSVTIYFKIKNKSKLPAWFLDDAMLEKPVQFNPGKKLIYIDFGLGDDDIYGIYDYAVKYVELKPGREINRIYKYSREEIAARLNSTITDNTFISVFVNASIAYFDQDVFKV